MGDTVDRSQSEKVLELMVQTPYIGGLRIKIEDWDTDWARLRLPFDERLTNDGRVYHGGAVASLVDTAGAAAAWSGHDLSRGTRASTVSMTVNYLSVADRSDLIAEARALKRGKELIFTTIEVSDVNDKLIASAVLTYRIAK